MSVAVLDLLRVSLETTTFGSTALLILVAIFVPAGLFFVARIPPFFTFVLISPLFVTFALAGLLPLWVVAATYMVFGIMWVFVLRVGINVN